MTSTKHKLWCIIVFCWVSGALGILCFNCTSTHHSDLSCAGEFAPVGVSFNNSRALLVNCSGDDTVCFVRSWAARGHFAWMVQRGCYQPKKGDTVPHSVTIPTRSMTCRQDRYADAEYKVCFCKADWCNSAPKYQVKHYIIFIFIEVLVYYINSI